MTLKRTELSATEAADFLDSIPSPEKIADAACFYTGEHPNLGDTVLIQRADGSAIAFSDGVRFGSEHVPSAEERIKLDSPTGAGRIVRNIAKLPRGDIG